MYLFSYTYIVILLHELYLIDDMYRNNNIIIGVRQMGILSSILIKTLNHVAYSHNV